MPGYFVLHNACAGHAGVVGTLTAKQALDVTMFGQRQETSLSC